MTAVEAWWARVPARLAARVCGGARRESERERPRAHQRVARRPPR